MEFKDELLCLNESRDKELCLLNSESVDEDLAELLVDFDFPSPMTNLFKSNFLKDLFSF